MHAKEVSRSHHTINPGGWISEGRSALYPAEEANDYDFWPGLMAEDQLPGETYYQWKEKKWRVEPSPESTSS
jgi:hypothetical protein